MVLCFLLCACHVWVTSVEVRLIGITMLSLWAAMAPDKRGYLFIWLGYILHDREMWCNSEVDFVLVSGLTAFSPPVFILSRPLHILTACFTRPSIFCGPFKI
jgi:hypothetical protein